MGVSKKDFRCARVRRKKFGGDGLRRGERREERREERGERRERRGTHQIAGHIHS